MFGSEHADPVFNFDEIRPACRDDIVGNRGCVEKIYAFVRDYPKTTKKAMLLVGPPGVGKTSGVHATCEELDVDVNEFNASMVRSKKGLMEMSEAFFTSTLENEKQVVLMDEVDGMSSNDRGGISCLVDMLKKTRVPVICTCNKVKQNMSTLKRLCEVVYFNPIGPNDLLRVARRVNNVFCLNLPEAKLHAHAENSGGDMRQMIHNITVGSDKKDGSVDAFRDMSSLFKLRGPERIKRALALYEEDPSLTPLLVHQNFTSASSSSSLKSLREISRATDGISLFDAIDSTMLQRGRRFPNEVNSFFALAYPAAYSESPAPRAGFPIILGKMSSFSKLNRQVLGIGRNTRAVSFTTGHSDIIEYARMIRLRIEYILSDYGKPGVTVENNDRMVRQAFEFSRVMNLDSEVFSDIMGMEVTKSAGAKVQKAAVSRVTRALREEDKKRDEKLTPKQVAPPKAKKRPPPARKEPPEKKQPPKKKTIADFFGKKN